MNKIKWLALAASNDYEILSKIIKGNGYEFTTDGFRMHVTEMDFDEIDLDSVSIEHKDIITKAVKVNQEAVTVERFGINPAYLIEALQAWADNAPNQPIEIEYCYYNGNHFIRIKNASYDDPRQAIITCMILPKEVDNQLPERTQSKSVSANGNDNTPREKQD